MNRPARQALAIKEVTNRKLRRQLAEADAEKDNRAADSPVLWPSGVLAHGLPRLMPRLATSFARSSP